MTTLFKETLKWIFVLRHLGIHVLVGEVLADRALRGVSEKTFNVARKGSTEN